MNEELRIIISAEIGKLRSELQKGQQEVQEFKSEADRGLNKVASVAKTASQRGAVALAALGAAFIGATKSLLGMVKETEEFRQSQALLETAFIDAGADAAVAGEVYEKLYRVLGDSQQATEAAQHLALLSTEEKALAEWTTIAQGVFAKFSGSIPVESLLEAANHTARLGEVQGTLADALEWTDWTVEEFNDALYDLNTVEEREAFIRKELGAIYKDAAKTYEDTAGSILKQHEAELELQKANAKLAETMVPVQTELTKIQAELIEKLTPAIQDFVDKHGEQFADLLLQLGYLLIDLATWAANNSEVVLSMIGTIASATIALGAFGRVIDFLGSASMFELFANSDKLVDVLKAVGQLFSKVGLKIAIIITVIVALVAAIILVIKYWDEVSAAAVKAWEWIKETFAPVGAWFMEIFQPLIDWFKGVWAEIQAGFGEFVAMLPGIWASIVEIFSAAWEMIEAILADPTVQKLIQYLSALLKTTIADVVNAFQLAWTMIKAVWSLVGPWFKALGDTITAIFKVVTALFTGDWKGAWEAIKKAAASVRDYYKTLGEAIKSIFSGVATFFYNSFANAWERIKIVFSAWGSFFTGLWTKIKNIFKDVGVAVGNAVGGTVKKAINAVLSTAVKIINGFIQAINSAISVINAIPGVDIKKLSTLDVPKMAEGGVVKSATLAMIGESGAEAVVPLEKNTEWLNKLADIMESRGGGKPTQIILTVDGKVFAQTAVSSINNLTRQSGKLALNLV